MISVILTELVLHLQISGLGQFVIFQDITNFHKCDLLQVLSIHHDQPYSCDILFFLR